MHPYLGLLIRLVLGAMWLTAGSTKLTARERPGEAAARFGLLPHRIASAVGTALPYAELALGVLLLAGLWTRAAAGVSAALLGLFGIAIALSLVRGRLVVCHCFGEMGHGVVSWWSVARNASLLAPALCLALFGSEYAALDGWMRGAGLRPGDPPLVEFVPVLLLAATAAVMGAMTADAWEITAAARRTEQARREARRVRASREEGHA